MLSDTFRHLGHGVHTFLIYSLCFIPALLADLLLACPVTHSLFPLWTLSWVLTFLNSAAFEPLSRASFKLLTWKTF